MQAMKVAVLGSVEVTAEGHQVELGGVRHRAILGYLVLHANTVVPTSQLLDALWHGNPPPTARKMVQNAVSGLRRALSKSTLRTNPPGYQLHVDPDDVDLFEFR